MYDERKINYDKNNNIRCACNIDDGATIYRLTSPSYANIGDAFTGAGCANSSSKGRFNYSHQRAIYCSNNILLCISEILFHNYRTTLDRIANNYTPELIREKIEDKKALVIAKTQDIGDMVYLDSKDFYREYRMPEVYGTWLVHPDINYPPYQTVAGMIRDNEKNGIMYPSARHSRDVAIVLFKDTTSKIKEDDYYALEVTLKLLKEDTTPANSSMVVCDPNDDKLHFTMGYYCFEDHEQFENLKNLNLINPSKMESSGMIDFVRRNYKDYPHDAVMV